MAYTKMKSTHKGTFVSLFPAVLCAEHRGDSKLQVVEFFVEYWTTPALPPF